ncbi:MAG: DNA polymerase III subunit gamma/tau [Desulfomonilia bacterium]|nr:DNA polymerase III subunit gamma/tau [Desulfomonilia bacterium]
MTSMYQVIARKFRPQRFDEVVGQEHVTRIITNAIEQNRLPHAFIFSGPRGVGKTSVARILAKALNCEQGLSSTPCNACARCEEITGSRAVDVFEIDAASHTGVDNIRDLIENSRYAPSVARYKVFIIDEVHMLSRSAFNALLKTLEEPPPHVIFIMATTELEKVPATVLSRCQRYDFRRIALEMIVSHLEQIAASEQIRVTKDALMILALQADGSMRDAQGMLEHVATTGSGEVDVDMVEAMLGLVGRANLHDLVSALVHKDAPSALKVVESVYQVGQDLGQLYKSLLEQFRNLMVLKAGYTRLTIPEEEKAFLNEIITEISLEEIHRILSVLIRSEEDLKYTSLPKITLETALLRVISAPRLTDLQELIKAISTRSGVIPIGQAAPVTTVEMYKRPPSTIPISWDGFLAYLKDHDQPLFAVLSSTALVSEEGEKIILECPSTFLADQVKKSLPEIYKRAKLFLKRDISILVNVQENQLQKHSVKPKPSELKAQAMKSPLVKEFMTEFGGVVRDVKPRE